MKKVLLGFIAIVMILSLNVYANAEEPVGILEKESFEEQGQIQPCYDYLVDHNEELLLTGGQASCKSRVVGKKGTTTKVEIKMTLQKKALLWWESEGTWSSTYDTYSGTLKITKAAESGTYRIKAVYKIYNGSDCETLTCYSAEKSC